MENLPHFLLLLFTFFHTFFSSTSQPYIGVNYGEVADNLPPPESTARLLKLTTISKIRLYGANPAVIRAFAGTNISLVIGTSNADIPTLAAGPSAAAAWISSNVLPFLPASSISAISVGNEVLTANDTSLSSQLLPAMQNLRSATPTGIKISTVHSMAVMSQSDPPSSGAFQPNLIPSLKPILQFLHDNESPFMVNPYPYFAYQSDQRPETLAFCLFQPNPGRPDPASGVTYTNMFDAQVAAVQAALRAAKFDGVEVVVAETGWPYRGDAGEAGTSVENAKAYNGNLVAHLRAMAQPVETYIFALYDEDLKPGPTSERSFGLFRPDLTPIYDAGLLKSPAPPPPAVTDAPPPAVTDAPPSAVTDAPPPANAITAVPAPREACVPGKGGATCGQPAVQNLPSNSNKSGAGLRRGWTDTCWLLWISVYLLYAALSVVLWWWCDD